MKAYQTAYKTATWASRQPKAGWVVRLTYDNGSTIICTPDDRIVVALSRIGIVASVEIGEGGVNFEDASWSVPSATIRLNDGKVAGTTFAAIADGTLTGYLVGKNFQNRLVEVWRFVEGMVDFTSHEVEFIGYTSNYFFDETANQWVFECVHRSEKSVLMLPQTEVTQEDYPAAPQESIGLKLPIVYGSFQHLIETISMVDWEVDKAINNFHLVPSVCIDANQSIFAFAHHECKTLTNTDVALYDEGLGNYLLGLDIFTSITNRPTIVLTGPTTADLHLLSGTRYIKADGLYILPKLTGSKDSGKTTPFSSAVDEDLVSFGRIQTDGSNQYLAARINRIFSNTYFQYGSTTATIKLYYKIVGHNGTGTYTGGVWNPVTATEDVSFGSTSGDGWTYRSVGTHSVRSNRDGTAISPSSSQWTWDELCIYDWVLKCSVTGMIVDVGVFGVLATDLIISELFYSLNPQSGRMNPVEQSSNPFNPFIPTVYRGNQFSVSGKAGETPVSSIFAELEGRMFGAWVDAGGRTNSYDEDDLITTSNFIIESILRDECGESTYIDTDSFDAVDNDGYELRFSQNQEIESRELIRQLSYFSRSLTWPKSSGSWYHFVIPDDPTAMSIGQIDYEDIKVLWVRPMHGSIINDITLKYHWDYGQGRYKRDCSAEDTTSQGTGATGYNHVHSLNIECPYLRYSSDTGATDWAQALADFHIANWKDAHYVIRFEMNNPYKFDFEDGDIIDFTNVDVNWGAIGVGAAGDYYKTFTAPRTAYWLITKRHPSPDLSKVTYEAVQLHDLT